MVVFGRMIRIILIRNAQLDGVSEVWFFCQWAYFIHIQKFYDTQYICMYMYVCILYIYIYIYIYTYISSIFYSYTKLLWYLIYMYMYVCILYIYIYMYIYNIHTYISSIFNSYTKILWYPICICMYVYCIYIYIYTYISSIFYSFLNCPIFSLATSVSFAHTCTAFHYFACRSSRFVQYFLCFIPVAHFFSPHQDQAIYRN